MPRAYLKEGEEEKAKTRKVVSEVPGQLYRHVMKEEIVAMVNPTTKKLLVEADQDLKGLQRVMPMPDLIESGVMRLAGERKVGVTKRIVNRQEEADKTNAVDIYQSAKGGGTPWQKRFYVAHKSGEVLGDWPQDVQQKVDSGLTLADCVAEGSMTLVGNEVVRLTSEAESPEAGERRSFGTGMRGWRSASIRRRGTASRRRSAEGTPCGLWPWSGQSWRALLDLRS